MSHGLIKCIFNIHINLGYHIHLNQWYIDQFVLDLSVLNVTKKKKEKLKKSTLILFRRSGKELL